MAKEEPTVQNDAPEDVKTTQGEPEPTTTAPTDSQDQQPKDKEGEQKPQPVDFNQWLESQPQEVRSVIDEGIKNLKTALRSEREARKELEAKIRELSAKAEKGSELEQELTKTADYLKELQAKTEFYEQAQKEGVANLKLAYLLVQSEQLYDRKGNPDFVTLKEQYPELFRGTKVPPASPGAGSKPEPKRIDMNQIIRSKAGRM